MTRHRGDRKPLIRGYTLHHGAHHLSAVLIVLRNRRRALRAWQDESRAAVDSAHLALGLLPASGQEILDRAHWQSVRQRVEEAVQLLDRAAGRAPRMEAAGPARRAAEAAIAGLGRMVGRPLPEPG